MSAEDASANQEAQNSICQIMDSLCPPGGNVGMSVKPIYMYHNPYMHFKPAYFFFKDQ